MPPASSNFLGSHGHGQLARDHEHALPAAEQAQVLTALNDREPPDTCVTASAHPS